MRQEIRQEVGHRNDKQRLAGLQHGFLEYLENILGLKLFVDEHAQN